jgi:hypothetical protein
MRGSPIPVPTGTAQVSEPLPSRIHEQREHHQPRDMGKPRDDPVTTSGTHDERLPSRTHPE